MWRAATISRIPPVRVLTPGMDRRSVYDMTSPIQPVKIPASDVVVGDVVVGHTLAGETVQEPVVHISHGFTRVTTMDAITDSPVIRLHFGRVGGEVIQFAPDALVPVLR